MVSCSGKLHGAQLWHGTADQISDQRRTLPCERTTRTLAKQGASLGSAGSDFPALNCFLCYARWMEGRAGDNGMAVASGKWAQGEVGERA
jgi:hypothetical protein